MKVNKALSKEVHTDKNVNGNHLDGNVRKQHDMSSFFLVKIKCMSAGYKHYTYNIVFKTQQYQDEVTLIATNEES